METWVVKSQTSGIQRLPHSSFLTLNNILRVFKVAHSCCHYNKGNVYKILSTGVATGDTNGGYLHYPHPLKKAGHESGGEKQVSTKIRNIREEPVCSKFFFLIYMSIL